MATLSQFSSQIRNDNISRPYLFYATLILPLAMRGSTIDTRKVSMYCHSAMTPGTNMYTNDNYVEQGIKRRVVYDYDIQNLTLQFFVDQNYEVKKFFDIWKNKIVTNRRNFEYPDDYSAESLTVTMISLNKSGDDNETVYKYIYKKVYPKSIQPIDLNNAATGQLTTFAVDFVFDTVTEESPGDQTKPVTSNNAGVTNTEILQSYDANRAKIISGLGGDYAGGGASGSF